MSSTHIFNNLKGDFRGSDNDLTVKYAQEVIEKLLGAEMSKLVTPQFLKNRTLTVNCLNTTAAEEIKLNQAEIVKKINKKLGKREVDRIRYLL